MPLKRALARTMASAFDDELRVTPKSQENHRENQEVGLLCTLFCGLDEGAYTQIIHNSSTRSHPSEGENRNRNRSKNCKCKRAYRGVRYLRIKTFTILFRMTSFRFLENHSFWMLFLCFTGMLDFFIAKTEKII